MKKESIDYFAWINENIVSDDLDNRVTERDLLEQGIKAVHKLIDDPDPAWSEDIDRSIGQGGRNTKNYSIETKIPEDYRKKCDE